MKQRESTERKNLLIKTIIVIILLLLSLIATILYVYAYPRTEVFLYSDGQIVDTIRIKKNSTLDRLPVLVKPGYTFDYWEDEDGIRFDHERVLTEDHINLYAKYNINQYTVTYHVQVVNDKTGQYEYVQNAPDCERETWDFSSLIVLPDGKDDKTGVVLDHFKARLGMTFVGWSTKIFDESEIESEALTIDNDNIHAEYTLVDQTKVIVYKPGGKFSVPAGNVDLYAIWEKDEYQVELYTGNEYKSTSSKPVKNGGIPYRDADGKFVIRNNRLYDITSIKYLDYLSGLTAKFVDMDLDVEKDGIGADEYDFIGWYLDPDYTLRADNFLMQVMIGTDDVPFLYYKEDNVYKKIFAELNDQNVFVFRLYSKWERRSYAVNFDKNDNASSGKIESFRMYKYDDLYGKFYNEGIDGRFQEISDFNYSDMNAGKYYNYIDLADIDITSESFMNSVRNGAKRFMGWTNTRGIEDDGRIWYYHWEQNDNKTLDYASSITRSESSYKHMVSEDVTFYAQWSTVYTLQFADSTSINKKIFTVKGIDGEWIRLEGEKEITARGWSKEFNKFIGWTENPSSSSAEVWYESSSDYTYTFSSKNRKTQTLYVLWQKEEYKIDFYLNDGSNNGGKGNHHTAFVPAYGGYNKNYPSSPEREGYIFKGWSLTQYENDEYELKLKNNNFAETETPAYTSSKSFRITGDAEYFATWTVDYTVIYDANGGTGMLPASKKYSDNFNGLVMRIVLGGGNMLKRTGYTFMGWGVKNPATDELYDINFRAGSNLVFDYVNMLAYVYSTPSVTYPIKLEKLEDGLNNKLIIYAKWKLNEYTITLKDTKNNMSSEVLKATYGSPFTLPDEEYMDGKYLHSGVKLLGWARSSTAVSVDYEAGGEIPASEIVRDYTFYTVYDAKQVRIEYKIIDKYGTTKNYTPPAGSGYSVGLVFYNTLLKLPTPTGAEYGDDNYKFSYWYYQETVGEETIKHKVENNSLLKYSEDTLTLYAEFVSLNFKVKFVISEPNGYKAIDDITIVYGNVAKGSSTGDYELSDPLDIYDEVNIAIEKFITDNNITEYTFLGFYNLYYGNGGDNLRKFDHSKTFDALSYPILGLSSEITFSAKWSPNPVSIVYYSDETKSDFVDTLHTGLNYETNNDIILANSNIFDLGLGKEIKSWYVIDGDGNKEYFDVSTATVDSYLVGNKYSSLSGLGKYITWSMGASGYEGTLEIFAETQFVFDVNYYRFDSNGTKELFIADSYIYSDQKDYKIIDSNLALYGDLKFVNWKLGSMDGNVINTPTIEIDSTKYPTFVVDIYVDMSFDLITYQWIESYGALVEKEVNRVTCSYYDYAKDKYRDSILIDTLPEYTGNITGADIVYYGLKYRDRVTPSDVVESTGLTLTCDGLNQEILIYLSSQMTITYNISSLVSDQESFDGIEGTKIIQEVNTGLDNTSAENFKVGRPYGNNEKLVTASKVGFVFAGWTIGKYTPGATIYQNDSELKLYENTDFFAYFEKPTAGTVPGVFRYYKNSGDNTYTDIEIANGIEYELLSGDDLDWNSDTLVIKGWINGKEYKVGDKFKTSDTMVKDTIYEFRAVWTERYSLIFDAGMAVANNVPNNVKVNKGDSHQITGKPTAFAENNEFVCWTFVIDETKVDMTKLGIDSIYYDGVIHIYENDFVVFVDSNSKYTYTSNTSGNITHYIPTTFNVWSYTLVGLWDRQSYTITLHITNPSDTAIDLDTSLVTSGLLVSNPYTVVVKYGDKYDPRDSHLIPADLLAEIEALAIANGNGIIGWSAVRGGTTSIDDLTIGITGDLELYSVWSQKYSFTFAIADSSFGYIDKDTNVEFAPEKEYFFAEETYEFDRDIIYSVYKKGSYTIYFTDGGYLVYEPSECNNEYYAVVGYQIDYNSGVLVKHLFSVDGYEIITKASNAVITPIITKHHKVEFFYNLFGKPTAAINELTLFVEDGGDVTTEELVVRTNYSGLVVNGFNLLGWNTTSTATSPISIVEDVTAYTPIYAIWESTIGAVFRLGSDELFTVRYNNSMKLDESEVSRMFGLEFTKKTVVSGNNNTYLYNSTLLYLDGFSYKGTIYNISDLCDIEFEGSVYINILMSTVYTLKFNKNTEEAVSGTINSDMYILPTGQITASGVGTLTLPTATVTRTYHEVKNWRVGEDANFVDILPLVNVTDAQLSKMIECAVGADIIVKCIWSPKSLELNINFAGLDSSGNVIANYDPYNEYKNYNNENDIISNIYSTKNYQNRVFILSRDNQRQNTDVSKAYTIQYGSIFKLSTTLNSLDNSNYGNYKLVGWSTTPLKLGDTYSKYFAAGAYGNTADILVEQSIITSGVIQFYPVFELITKEITVSVTYGNASVLITDNSLVSGWMESLDYKASAVVTGSDTFEVVFYNSITVVADSPINKNFEFDRFTGLGTDDTYGSYPSRHLEVAMNGNIGLEYRVIEINLTIEMEYVDSLIGATIDTTYFSINNHKITQDKTTDTVKVNGVDGLVFDYEISGDFRLINVIDINGDTFPLSTTLTLDSLVRDGNDSYLKFILAPVEYKLTFYLNGGTFDNNILNISNDKYSLNSTTIDASSGSVVVYAGTEITLPNVTRSGFEFIHFVDGENRVYTSSVEVNSELALTAIYNINTFRLTYRIAGITVSETMFNVNDTILVGDGIKCSVVGKEIVGWTHTYNAITTTYQVGHPLKLTNQADYIFDAVLNGLKVNIVYNYLNADGSDGTNAETFISWGDKISALTESDLGQDVDDQYIYEWQFNGTPLRAINGEIAFDSLGLDDYTPTINLNAIYYNEYTFNVSYVLENSSTNISPETVYAYSNSNTGSINSGLYYYTISTITPINNNSTQMFAGYTLSINGNTDTDTIYSIGEMIELTVSLSPLKYEYKLVLTATWDNIQEAKDISVFITNPKTSDNMTLSCGESYDSVILITQRLTPKYLPSIYSIAENVTWVVESSGDTFTHFNEVITSDTYYSFAHYRLLGYRVYGYIGEERRELTSEDNILTIDSILGLTCGGYDRFEAYTVWEEKVIIKYYDQGGAVVVEKYVDKNSQVELVSVNKTILDANNNVKNYTFERLNHTFVGVATSHNKAINYANDFYPFGYTMTMTESISLYPAFVKDYSIILDLQMDLLEDNGGNRNLITSTNGPNNIQIGTMNILSGSINLTDVRTHYGLGYTGQGFSISGISLDSGFLGENEITLIDEYSLDSSHDEDLDGIIYLYLIWQRSEGNIEFKHNAYSNTGKLLSNETYTISAKYGETISLYFDGKPIPQLQTFINVLIANYPFVEFTNFTTDAHKTNVVTEITANVSNIVIYINYTYKYSIQYELTSEVNLKEGAILPDKQIVELGQEINYFSIDNLEAISISNKVAYWSADAVSDFFENMPRIFTAVDQKLADASYVITLRPVVTEKTFKVTIKYFASESAVENEEYSSSNTVEFTLGQTIEQNINKFKFGTMSFSELLALDIGSYEISDYITIEGVEGLKTRSSYKAGDREEDIIYLVYLYKSVDMIFGAVVVQNDDHYTMLDTQPILNADYVSIIDDNSTTVNFQGYYNVVKMTLNQQIKIGSIGNYISNEYYNFLGWKTAARDNDGVVIENKLADLSAGENGVATYDEATGLMTFNSGTYVYAVFEPILCEVIITVETDSYNINDLYEMKPIVTDENDAVVNIDSPTILGATKTYSFFVPMGTILNISGTAPVKIIDSVEYDVFEMICSRDTIRVMNNEEPTLVEIKFNYIRKNIYINTVGTDLIKAEFILDGETYETPSAYIESGSYSTTQGSANYKAQIPLFAESKDPIIDEDQIVGLKNIRWVHYFLEENDELYTLTGDAADIVIDYVLRDANSDKNITALVRTITYPGSFGKNIELLNMVVEDDSTISTGWIIENVNYDLGDSFLVKKTHYYAYRCYTNKYQVEYSNNYSSLTNPCFDLTGFNPQPIGEMNYVVLAGHEYVRVDNNTTTYVVIDVDTDTTYLRNYVSIPNISIPDATTRLNGEELGYSVKFSRFGVKSDTYETGDLYTFKGHHLNGNKIELVVIFSNAVELKFYIESPYSTANADKCLILDNGKYIYTISGTPNGTARQNYIPVNYDLSSGMYNGPFPKPNDVKGSANAVLWLNMGFTKWDQTLYGDDSVYGDDADFVFMGWQTNSGYYIPIYNVVNGIFAPVLEERYENVVDYSVRRNLTSAINNGEFEFYAVFKKKINIKFNADEFDPSVTQELSKLAYEDMIIPSMYNGYSLTNEQKSWIGWETEDKSYRYFFSSCYNSTLNNCVIETPSEEIELFPIWLDGAVIRIDVNFENSDEGYDYREYYSKVVSEGQEVIDANGNTIGNYDTILNNTHYPQLDIDSVTRNTSYLFAGSESHSIHYDTVNNKDYYLTFLNSSYIPENSVIDMQYFTFLQDGIYPHIFDGISEFFEIVGWKLVVGTKEYACSSIKILSLTQTVDSLSLKVVLNGSTELTINGIEVLIKPIWKPTNVEVALYSSDTYTLNRTTLTIPFGSKLVYDSSVINKFADEMFEYNYIYDDTLMTNALSKSELESNIDNPYGIWRFMYWMFETRNSLNNLYNNRLFDNTPDQGVSENIISRNVVKSINAYPYFEEEFKVMFFEKVSGEDLGITTYYGNNARIHGEQISVPSALGAWYNYVDVMEYARSANTFTVFTESPISLGHDFGKFGTGQENNQRVHRMVYIYIRFTNIYINYYSDPNNSTTYNSSLIAPILNYRTSTISHDYLSFNGWVMDNDTNLYEQTNTIYNLHSTKISSVRLRLIDSKVVIYINGKADNYIIYLSSLPTGQAININLYAQYLTTTTISLPTGASPYAQMSYGAANDYFQVDREIRENNLVIGVTYTSVYNSPVAPNIFVNSNGYTISKMVVTSLGNAEVKTWNNDVLDIPSTTDVVDDYFTITSARESSQISKSGKDYWYSQSTVAIYKNSLITSSTEILLTITPLVYSVNYKYDSSKFIVTYLDSNSTYNSFPEDTSGSIVLDDQDIFRETDTVSRFTLEYSKSYDSANGLDVITFSGVPYNTTFYFSATAIVSGTVNYFGWTQDPETSNPYNFDLTSSYQDFTPAEADGSSHSHRSDYTLVMLYGTTPIEDLRFEILFDPDVYGEDPWSRIFNNTVTAVTNYSEFDKYSLATTVTTESIATGTRYKFVYDVNLKSGADPITYAGEDAGIIAIINLFNDGLLNNSILHPTTVTGSTLNMDMVLKYFFIDGVWDSYSGHSGFVWNKQDGMIIEDSTYQGTGSSTLCLYTFATRAVYAEVSHETVNYTNPEEIISIDRADLTFGAYSSSVTFGNSTVDLIVSSSNDKIGVIIPCDNSATISISPAEATDNNASYTVYNWKGISTDPIGDKNTIEIESNENQDFSTISQRKLPHLIITAQVVSETITIDYRNHDASLIGSYSVSFDKDIYNMNNTQYIEYNIPSLQYLHNNYRYYYTNSQFIPYFDVAINMGNNTAFKAFNYSGVSNSKQPEGKVQYYFTHWSDEYGVDSDYGVTTAIRESAIFYACYYKNNSVVYNVATLGDNEYTRYTYYIPETRITDSFGTEYSNSFYLPAITRDIKTYNLLYEADSDSAYAGRMYYYDNNNIIPAETMSEVPASLRDGLNIYPGIRYSVNYNNSEVQYGYYSEYTIDSTSNTNKCIVSLGGLYSVLYTQYATKSVIKFDTDILPVDYSYSVSVSTKIDDIAIYDYSTTETSVTVGRDSVTDFRDGETNRDWAYFVVNDHAFNYTTPHRVYFAENVNIYSHTNATISSWGLAEDCVWSTGNSLEISYVSLESSPSLRNFVDLDNGTYDDDYEYTYRLEITGPKKISLMKVYNNSSNTKEIWNVTCNNPNIDKVTWQIQYQGFGKSDWENIVVSDEVGKYVYIDDEKGIYNITILSEFEYYVDDFGVVVTNRRNLETAESVILLTPTSYDYDGPLPLPVGKQVNITNTDNKWSISIDNIHLFTVDTSNLYFKSEDYASTDYLINFRFQYGNGGAVWIDLKDGDYLSEYYFEIRLVCEWVEKEINITHLASYNISTPVSDNASILSTYGAISLKAGKENHNIKVTFTDDYVGDGFIFTIYAGDYIAVNGNIYDKGVYDFHNSGTINTKDRLFGLSQTLNMSRGENINKDYFVQGWLIPPTDYYSSIDYYSSRSFDSISVDEMEYYLPSQLILWAEDRVEIDSIKVLVDRSYGDYSGIGDVIVNADLAISAGTRSDTLGLANEISADTWQIRKYNSTYYYYKNTMVMGVSSIINVKASINEKLKHKLVQFTSVQGEKRVSNGTSDDSLTLTALEASQQPIKILFNASCDKDDNDIRSSLSFIMVDPKYEEDGTNTNKAVYYYTTNNSQELITYNKYQYSGYFVTFTDNRDWYDIAVYNYFGESYLNDTIYKEYKSTYSASANTPYDGYYLVGLSTSSGSVVGSSITFAPASPVCVSTIAYDENIGVNDRSVNSNILGVKKFKPVVGTDIYEVYNNTTTLAYSKVVRSADISIDIEQPKTSSTANVAVVSVSLSNGRGVVSISGNGITGTSEATYNAISGCQITRIEFRSNGFTVVSVENGETAQFDIQRIDYEIYFYIEAAPFNISFFVNLAHEHDYQFLDVSSTVYDGYSDYITDYEKINDASYSSKSSWVELSDIQSANGIYYLNNTSVIANGSANGYSLTAKTVGNTIYLSYDKTAFSISLGYKENLYSLESIDWYEDANSMMVGISGSYKYKELVTNGALSTSSYIQSNGIFIFNLSRLEKTIYTFDYTDGSSSVPSWATTHTGLGGLTAIGITETNDSEWVGSRTQGINFVANATADILGRDDSNGFDNNPISDILWASGTNGVSNWQDSPYAIVPVDSNGSFTWNWSVYNINYYLQDSLDWAIIRLNTANTVIHSLPKEYNDVFNGQQMPIMYKQMQSGDGSQVIASLPSLTTNADGEISFHYGQGIGESDTGLYTEEQSGGLTTPVDYSDILASLGYESITIIAWKVVVTHRYVDSTGIGGYDKIPADNDLYARPESEYYAGNTAIQIDIYPIWEGTEPVQRKIYIKDDRFKDIFPEYKEGENDYYWYGNNGQEITLTRSTMQANLDGNNKGKFNGQDYLKQNFKVKSILAGAYEDNGLVVGNYQNAFYFSSTSGKYYVFGGFRLEEGGNPDNGDGKGNIYSVDVDNGYTSLDPNKYPVTVNNAPSVTQDFSYTFTPYTNGDIVLVPVWYELGVTVEYSIQEIYYPEGALKVNDNPVHTFDLSHYEYPNRDYDAHSIEITYDNVITGAPYLANIPVVEITEYYEDGLHECIPTDYILNYCYYDSYSNSWTYYEGSPYVFSSPYFMVTGYQEVSNSSTGRSKTNCNYEIEYGKGYGYTLSKSPIQRYWLTENSHNLQDVGTQRIVTEGRTNSVIQCTEYGSEFWVTDTTCTHQVAQQKDCWYCLYLDNENIEDTWSESVVYQTTDLNNDTHQHWAFYQCSECGGFKTTNPDYPFSLSEWAVEPSYCSLTYSEYEYNYGNLKTEKYNLGRPLWYSNKTGVYAPCNAEPITKNGVTYYKVLRGCELCYNSAIVHSDDFEYEGCYNYWWNDSTENSDTIFYVTEKEPHILGDDKVSYVGNCKNKGYDTGTCIKCNQKATVTNDLYGPHNFTYNIPTRASGYEILYTLPDAFEQYFLNILFAQARDYGYGIYSRIDYSESGQISLLGITLECEHCGKTKTVATDVSVYGDTTQALMILGDGIESIPATQAYKIKAFLEFVYNDNFDFGSYQSYEISNGSGGFITKTLTETEIINNCGGRVLYDMYCREWKDLYSDLAPGYFININNFNTVYNPIDDIEYNNAIAMWYEDNIKNYIKYVLNPNTGNS